MRLALLLALGACGHPKPASVTPARGPLSLTYLGVAGWELTSGAVTVVADPYFSRPDLSRPIVSDPAAVAAHAPKHAALVLVGHSHVDHLLDAPAVAVATGAELIGSDSSTRFARARGVAADHLITVKGGEDYEFAGVSVRVIPSLHSALDHKHAVSKPIAAEIPAAMTFDDFAEGGTFIYLVRLGGHQVLVMNTANFIERELEGVHPDVAIIAPGLRGEIHDYTCRLLGVLGHPPVVYATHFDDWQAPPPTSPVMTDDLQAFVAEIHRCSPATRVVVPVHFATYR